MDFYGTINMLYNKKKIDIDIDNRLNITLLKFLSFDRNNLIALKNVMKYQFFLTPLHFFYMLYFSIPKRMKAPFLKNIKKQKPSENKLLDKIRYVLGWSNADLRKNYNVINQTILTNSKHWKKELGVR